MTNDDAQVFKSVLMGNIIYCLASPILPTSSV